MMSTPNTPQSRRGCRYVLRLLLVLIVAVLVAYNCVIPAYIAYVMVHTGHNRVADLDPANQPFTLEDVSFTTADGLEISAWYSPSRNRSAIILVHGSMSNRSGTLNHAKFLTDAGYGVLMIDLRGHGNSGGDLFTLGWDSDQDVRAAVDYLQSRDEVDLDKIGAMGLSMGAEVVLQAAAEDDRIKAVVSDGAGFRTPGDVLAADDNRKWLQLPFLTVQFTTASLLTHVPMPPPLTELLPKIAPRPLLIIYSTKGNPGEIVMSDAYGRAAGATAEIWRLEGVGHIAGVTSRPDEYRTKVVNFFNQAFDLALPSPATTPVQP